MLENLYLPTLKVRRSRAKLQMVYKITNNLVSVPNDCLIPTPSLLRSGYFNQLSTRIDSFKFSFFFHLQSNYGTQSPLTLLTPAHTISFVI